MDIDAIAIWLHPKGRKRGRRNPYTKRRRSQMSLRDSDTLVHISRWDFEILALGIRRVEGR
jgi:hypothetical protein